MKLFLRKICISLIFIFGLKNQVVWSQNRIVGGNEIDITQAPYMLLFVAPLKNSTSGNICGAGIINNEWALTAAHCLQDPNMDADRLGVIAGTSNLMNMSTTAKRYKVVEYIAHENYTDLNSKGPAENDIALIKISPPLEFNNATQPLKLPEIGKPLKTQFITIAGWGRTEPRGNISLVLRQVRLPRVSTLICKLKYRLVGLRIHDDELCYGFHFLGITKDKCNGDSGGPLVNDDGIVVAVVSKGSVCGKLGLPGIDTSVLYHRDWIKEKTGI